MFCFQDRVSVCNPGWSETQRSLCISLQTAGIKDCATIVLFFFFLSFYGFTVQKDKGLWWMRGSRYGGWNRSYGLTLQPQTQSRVNLKRHAWVFKFFCFKTGFLYAFSLDCPETYSLCRPGWAWTHKDLPASLLHALKMSKQATEWS